MQSNLTMRTSYVCSHIWSDFGTYSSPDLILLSVQSPEVPPLAGTSGSPVSCHIQWSANRQNIVTNRWHIEKPTMEN